MSEWAMMVRYHVFRKSSASGRFSLSASTRAYSNSGYPLAIM